MIFPIPKVVYPEWFTIRLKVLQRDNYTCQSCGQMSAELDIHHIIPRRNGGTNELENLTALCRRCHNFIE